MATHSSILAWRIPWTEEPGVLQSMGHKESDRTEQQTHFTKVILHLNEVSSQGFKQGSSVQAWTPPPGAEIQTNP